MCTVKLVIAVAAVKLMLSWPTLVAGLDALALIGPLARAGAPVTSTPVTSSTAAALSALTMRVRRDTRNSLGGSRG
jgi:hypothetical protein